MICLDCGAELMEMKQTMREQIVLNLWGKGLMPDGIEAETGIDIDAINDIIECEENYRGQHGNIVSSL